MAPQNLFSMHAQLAKFWMSLLSYKVCMVTIILMFAPLIESCLSHPWLTVATYIINQLAVLTSNCDCFVKLSCS